MSKKVSCSFNEAAPKWKEALQEEDQELEVADIRCFVRSKREEEQS